MIVYHGSNTIVEAPDVQHSRNALDFGRGFYVTTLESQARRWCKRFARFGEAAVLNRYTLDETALDALRLLMFEGYTEAWLDFVVACRLEKEVDLWDVVAGGVANDKVFNTCELFFKGYISKEAALDRLRFEQPTNQYCFRTQRAIDLCLSFEGGTVL